uniref:Histidine kinase/HSP90-like ATPase domain-containing protein n=1 Tax=uncultured organism MedDCM-OCT-S09-C20 TaxID=743645 RepID=D6PKX6_9ZZZZ|nr:hypothetical protein [uncultured organism MedDCM-OCT-S09-C20]
MTSLSLEIRNAHQALSILGNSCDYFQQFRELTENVADQAQMQPDLNVLATWDYDRSIESNGLTWGDLHIPAGRLKLACTDNGPGMDQATLEGPIRSLFNSGSGHERGNFGIGAKIACLSKNAGNALGILIITKVVGHAPQVCLLNEFGLVGYPVADEAGDIELWPVVTAELAGIEVPKLITNNGHGTCVVLLGDTPERNTIYPPLDIWERMSGKRNLWLVQYFKRRYYALPSNMKLRGFELESLRQREGTQEDYSKVWDQIPQSPRGRTNPTQSRGGSITYQEFIQQFAEMSGQVEVTNGVIDWYVITKTASTQTNFQHMIAAKDRAGAAVLWRDELYEREPSSSLAKFGIYAGERQVVLIVRPEDEMVEPDPTRINLRINGTPVAGDYMRRWASEFRNKVKDTELGSWMASQGSSQSGDSRNKMLEQLKQFGCNLKIKGLRLVTESDTPEPATIANSGVPAVMDGEGASGGARKGKGAGEGSQRNAPVTHDPAGNLIGIASQTDCAPDVEWLGKDDFNHGDKQAGRYAPGDDENPLGKLVLNEDYRFIGELTGMLFKQVSRYQQAKVFSEEQLLLICTNLVKHYVSQDLCEIVLRCFKNEKALGNQWVFGTLDETLSPDVITAMTLRSSTVVPVMIERFRANAGAWMEL